MTSTPDVPPSAAAATSNALELSVVICTHNPDRHRLSRTLEGLAAQTLASARWEILLVDNGSKPALTLTSLPRRLSSLRIVTEPALGLTPARLRGIAAATGSILIFVDDDNVLAPDFLTEALEAFSLHPKLAAAGGPIAPEYEIVPPTWLPPFQDLLAVRDFGPSVLLAQGAAEAAWPEFAPVGAGLCVRHEAALAYARVAGTDPNRTALDRRGGQLTSGGDSDLVFTILRAGGDVAYLPQLKLTHLIPAARVHPGYLAQLNRSIQRSWVHVLALHGERPWPPIPSWSVPLRVARAWMRSQAWRGPAEQIRFRGLEGRFLGQADMAKMSCARSRRPAPTTFR